MRISVVREFNFLPKMSEELHKAGLFFDDIYRLRVQDPRLANETEELREGCLDYANKLQEFKRLADDFHNILRNYAKHVEKEKLRAIATQNQLKTIAQQRQTEQQIYQTKIHEKNLELERLKNEYLYLQRIEGEQQELINSYLMNQ